MGRGDHEHMLKVLERACHIYSTFQDTLELSKAHAVLSLLIEKVKTQFYSTTPRGSDSTQSPSDSYDIYSQNSMSATPESSTKDNVSRSTSEHSAAVGLELLSTGLTPGGPGGTGDLSEFTAAPGVVPMDMSSTGLTPMYQPATPGNTGTAVPFSFFSQGMGMGMDGGGGVGWVKNSFTFCSKENQRLTLQYCRMNGTTLSTASTSHYRRDLMDWVEFNWAMTTQGWQIARHHGLP